MVTFVVTETNAQFRAYCYDNKMRPYETNVVRSLRTCDDHSRRYLRGTRLQLVPRPASYEDLDPISIALHKVLSGDKVVLYGTPLRGRYALAIAMDLKRMGWNNDDANYFVGAALTIRRDRLENVQVQFYTNSKSRSKFTSNSKCNCDLCYYRWRLNEV